MTVPRQTPRLMEIFGEAVERASAAEMAAYLDHACGDDLALRDRVEGLIRAHGQAGSFLEAPAGPPTVDPATGGAAAGEGPGTIIGPYKLLEPIGEGGMGLVYMAEQTHPVRRRVALKVIRPGMDSRQVLARFEAERQALALMDHPNIARVLDAGTTGSGRPYFVMELVRGIPITEYCDQEQLSLAERLELFVLICRAVQHAHQKGIIHRDLKPSNVLVTIIDGAAVPKVIDFGVAKAAGQSLTDRTLFTGFAQLVGTPLYMSPEQAQISGVDVDTRSDIYSLGVVLYELLTGTTPFDSETLRRAAFDEMRRIIREEEPPKPSTRLSSLGGMTAGAAVRRSAGPRRLDRAVRGELDWIAMKALEKDRRRRYETAGALADDVMNYLADRPVEACPPSVRYRFGKFARRNRAALSAAALVAGALLLGLTGSIAMAVRARDAERKTGAALGRVRDALGEADRQRDRARRAVDEMYTEVAARWLAHEGGVTPLQREFLEKALAFYEEFAHERTGDAETRAEAARAAARVGEIRAQLGRTAEALEAHGRALAGFRVLAAESPERPEYRREVARSLFDMALLDETLGRTKDAEPAHRESLALRERLAEAPGSPSDRTDLAAGLRGLGGFLRATNRNADAETALLRSKALLDRLTAEAPAGEGSRAELARTEEQLGALYLWTNRYGEVEAPLRRSLALRRAPADAAPTDPDRQHDLAAAYVALGDWRRKTYRYQEAAQELRRALPILEKLAADRPDRPRYRSSLAKALSLLTEMLGRLGQPDEMERTLRRSQEILEKLAADYPDVPYYRDRIAQGQAMLGDLLARRGRAREAREALEKAYEIRKKLAADHPELRLNRHNLAANCYLAAVTLATMDGAEGRDYARSRGLARESVAIEPEVAGFWKGLALAEYRVGDLDAALMAETKALERRKGDSYRYDWLLLALIHLGRGDREQARWWAITLLDGESPAVWKRQEWNFIQLVDENAATLRALLPADAEARVELLKRAAAGLRADQGEDSEAALKALENLANQLVRVGRYGEASDRFEESLRLRPEARSTQWLPDGLVPLAVLKLRAGDAEGYRAVCTRTFRQVGDSGTGGQAARLVRLVTMSPAAGVDPERSRELARRAVELDPEDPISLLALGASEYRAGRHEAAVETLTRSIKREAPDLPAVRTQARLFLAMAQHRLGRDAEARRALTEADRDLATAPVEADPTPSDSSRDWHETMLARLLRREADEVLGMPAADKPGD